MLRRLLSLLSPLFPAACLVCGRRVEIGAVPVCEECLSAQAQMAYRSAEHGTFERLFWKHFPVERAAAMYFFHEGHVRALVHAFKYYQHPHLARALAQRWAEQMLGATDFFDGIEAIVPLPLHPWRQLRRGYNQSYYLARGIACATGLPIARGAVVRRGKASTQTRLHGLSARQANVEGVFRLKHPERIEGKHVLLVDDVATTGSTLIACARTLARVPGVRISVFAFAYAGTVLRMADDWSIDEEPDDWGVIPL